MVDVTTTDGNTKTLPLLSSILPITRLTLTSGIGNGVPTQFPPRGIVRIGGNYLYYSSISGLTLNGVVNLRDQIAMIRPTGFAYPLARSDVSWSTNSLPPPVILLSIEAAGADALEMAGAQTIRYKTTPLGDTAASEYQGTVPDANNQSPERKYFLLQLLDPTTGKCEWLNYAEILRTINSGPQFFLSRAGWMYTPRVNNLVGIRGAQRTETPGRQGSLTAGQTFPANTLLIPVQTELGSEAHLLATGDVITLMPNDLSSGLTSQQAVVRYAAMDGYGDGNLQDSSDSDTKNEFFAFSSALPDSTPPLASQVQILKWPCWNGIDLTPMTSVITKAGILPRLDGFGANGRFLIGNIDPDTSSGPTTSPQEMTIDALVSGPLSNVSLTDSSNASGLSIRNVFDPFGTPTGSGLPVGGFIESAGIIGSPGYKILRETTNDKPALGLLLINGESVVVGPITTADAQLILDSATVSVTAPYGNDVAAIQSSGSFAKIIARGVLDPQRTTPIHSWSTGPVRVQDNKELRPLIPALLLPIGPIVQVHGSMTDGQWYQVTDGWENASGSPTRPRFDAPAALWLPLGGNTPAAAAPEIIAMTAQRTRRIFDPNLNPPGFRDDGTELLTAEWQRRLYNTTLGSIADKDLLIGWWPRYPSALPKDSSGPELERMRSRTYAWVGFPLGMWRMRFDKALLTGVAGQRNALATILNTDSDDLFTFEFRTLTTGFNWLSAGVLDGVDSGADIDLSDAWSNIPANTEWDGAEMRAHWRYAVDAASADVTSNLAAVANAANRAPALGPVRIRFRAPALILGVEAGR